MGCVYKAEHTKLGRKVALKLLRSEYAAKREAVHRFFNEARAVNDIGHANIVDITDYVELPGGETFFIMELLPGRDLGKLIRNRPEPLPLQVAMEITLQVCDALQAAHSKSIIHRDLKPDNVFVTEHRKGVQVKLLDFGVAKLVGDAADESSLQTAAGSVLGTPAYMSPEQATGIPVDHRTDIYSLGAILYEMFTGRPLFRAKSFGEYVLKHMNEMPVPPRDLPGAPGIPLALEQVVLRCLEKNPDDRYPSIEALREDLARVSATVETSVRRHRGTAAEGDVPRMWAILGVVAIVVLAGGAFWFAAGLEIGDLLGGESAQPESPAPAATAPAPDALQASAASVPAGGTAAVRSRTARLQLYTQPAGATVHREDDTRSLGTTPLMLDIPLDEEQTHVDLRFRLPGHRETRERVRVVDGAVVSVVLQPIAALQPPRSPGAKTRPRSTRAAKPRRRAHDERRGKRTTKATPKEEKPPAEVLAEPGTPSKPPKAKRIAPNETVNPFNN
jgi:serine/threonine-protein kinase